MKGTGQFKVTKRGFDGQWITFTSVGRLLTRGTKMWDFLQVVERNVTWLMRRPESVDETGGFRLSGGVESWTSPTLVSVRFASNRDSAVLPSGIASSDIYG
ncbi:hypothetical protein AVEN_159605-1 [Araneus ventricosus]|uniref:Uncharacterized protein n=1 Tax=Araneus ventricosus TaxID=182803 RepID=A0A4Y2PQ46_ARAVE|nr:hypothetical protein AVEN_159605-1 [Araneus ventricosus]